MKQTSENNLDFVTQGRAGTTWWGCFFCLLLGSLACMLSVVVIDLPEKYLIALFVTILFASILLSIRSSKYIFNILLALFAFSISINLDINFFVQKIGAGTCAITFSLPLVLVLILILSIFIDTFPRFPKIRYCPSLLVPTGLYMVAGIGSLLNATYPSLVFFELFRLSMLLLICLFVMNLKNYSHLIIIIRFLCLAVLLQGTLAIIQYKTGKQLGLGIFGEEELVAQFIGFKANRATGTIGHPNGLAYFFEILLPLVFAMFLTTRGKWNKLFYVSVLIVGFMGILTTLSRGGWVAIGIVLPLVFITLYHRQIFKLKTALASFCIGILLIAPLYFSYPIIVKRFTHTDYGSSSLRMPLNKAAFSLVEQFPFFGVGLNNLSEVFRHYDLTGYTYFMHGNKSVPHNLYLFVWSEVGTFGFVSFLLIFIMMFFLVLRVVHQVSFQQKGILIGICGGISAHLIHGMFDPGFKLSLLISILLYTLIGFIGAVFILNRGIPKDYLHHIEHMNNV